jgi:hypothetical protein
MKNTMWNDEAEDKEERANNPRRMSRSRGGKKHRDEMSDDEAEDKKERASTGRANNPRTMSRSRGGKKPREKMSHDESEDEEERASTGRANNPRTRVGKKESYEMSDNESEDEEERPLNPSMIQWLQERCLQLQATIKSLQREIKVLKSHDRKTKRQLRIDYDWNGEDANLSDKVSNWVKTYLFPRYKFLNDGWMSYQDGYDSLSSFVQRKMKLEVEDDFQGLWDRVIRPTIQQKYVTVRSNMNNEVRKVYKSK